MASSIEGKVYEISGKHFEMKRVKPDSDVEWPFLRVAGTVIVLFYKNDCKFCPGAKEAFTKVSKFYPPIKFCRLNCVKENIDFIKSTWKIPNEKLQIRSTPKVLIYEGGKPVMSLDGTSSFENIRSTCESYLRLRSRDSSTPRLPPRTERFDEKVPIMSSSAKKSGPVRLESSATKRSESAIRHSETEMLDGIPFNMVCDDEGCYITEGESIAGKCEGGVCEFAFEKDL